ncbi:MAG: DUF1385 domain-containing protein [Deltaproteobacteria bacterium]|nr:DUF1385 domain-containing protein [Deltaproteobacteria bacterium]
MSEKRPYIGGQAVLEGVMMRSPKSFVVAVRRPDGSLAVREQAWSELGGGMKFLKWPLFRGGITLVESLWNGYSALSFSAEQVLPEDEKPADARAAPVGAASAPSVSASKPSDSATTIAMMISTLFAVALFVATPHLLTVLVGRLLGMPLPTTGIAFNAIDAGFKLLIFVAYLSLIARSPQVQRVFQYHGAEHKAIWAYESGGPLTPEHAQTFTTLHPRCGTSFLVMVMGVSFIVTTLVFSQVPQLSPHLWLHHVLLVLIKLPLMFPIAGITYELQRVTARPNCPAFLKWLAKPGLALQKVTTREPSLDQLEVAVTALARALAREEGKQATDGVHILPSALAQPATT